VRFRRQVTGLELEIPPGAFGATEAAQLTEAFGKRYQEVYGAGSGNADAGVEVYRIRVDAIVRVPKPRLTESQRSGAEAPVKSHRQVTLANGRHDVPVYEWAELTTGGSIEGPAIVEAEFTTVFIPEDCTAVTDQYSNVVLTLR
jgi:N-methylhydantoinase A/oxoprolinase/acetone carboxylase beta subunit